MALEESKVEVPHANLINDGVRVEVQVDMGRELTLTVIDDGVGIAADVVTGRGTVNLRERAEALGGTIEVSAAEPRGTRLRWSVPASD